MEIILNYIEQYYPGINNLPENILFSMVIAVICLILLISCYSLILLKRILYVFHQSRNRYWNDQITDLINVFLSKVDEGNVSDPVSKILPEFSKLPLGKRFIQYLLYDQILAYHRHFTGNAAQKLKVLFLNLQLDQLIAARLNSRHIEIKIRGIIDAAHLELTSFSPLIKKLLHHPSSEIRIEAQAAYIMLNKAHSFEFLNDLQEPIQDWHQLVLMEQINKLNPNELPRFSRWLNSSNRSVIELCLKLIGHFQQFDAVPMLIGLLNHLDEELKVLSIKILGEFEAEDAEPALLNCYAHATDEQRAAIIKALGRINTGNQLEFFINAAASPQFEIAFEASSALIANGSRGIGLLKNYQKQAPAMNSQIMNHLLDTRITAHYGILD